MLKASPVFLNCFYRLVASIIREGRQKGENEKGGPSPSFIHSTLLTAKTQHADIVVFSVKYKKQRLRHVILLKIPSMKCNERMIV